jgi:hypothetical protein
MMKKLIAVLLLAVCTSVSAQHNYREEILQYPELAASNSVAYPTVVKSLSPAPKGMRPFYLSHYGRHGSRYLTKTKDYHYVPEVMRKADSEGKLTPLGRDVLRRAERLSRQAEGRWGDLTAVGTQQHKDIARRMVKNFPQLFKGSTHVDARSTLVSRCVLSMANTIQQLLVINPKLRTTIDASPSDLYFMNYQDALLRSQTRPANLEAAYNDFCNRHWQLDRLMRSLFNDTAYINRHIDAEQMQFYLFRLAGSVQDTELRDSLTLFDIFTPEEIYNNWLTANVWWYLGYGFTPLNGGTQPYTQRHLLRRLITDADSCIAQQQPNVQLRFGHDTMLMPLICLMGINGYNHSVNDLDSLAPSGWIDYRVFPMAANLQLVFYRRHANDRDVVLKVLLNEEEATLPLPTDQYPYYRWNDVKEYLLQVLSRYKE